jgi:nucleotide-binding universal stress UspA family protein
MKVIIATDGSAISGKVVNYGIKFAVKMGAAVHGVYVVSSKILELQAMEHHDDTPGHEAEFARMKKYGDDALAVLASRCAGASLKATTSVLQGDPADEIVRLAAAEKADLIVVGNVSKTNIEYMFMGSVSESVIRKSPCPVLVVRGDMKI